VTDFNGHQITIGSTADGEPKSQTLGSSGDTITTSYDPIGSQSAITLKNSSSTQQSFTYSDAPSGNILSETDTPTSPQSPAGYTYDAQGRVTSMTPGSGSANNYGFDASSNLTTLPTGATGTYNNAGELTSSTLSGTTTNYTYNADGEQLTATQGSATLSSGTWNGAGQLTAYSDSAANMTAAGYDGTGMRASSTITPSGGSSATQAYVWNTVPQIPQLIMDSSNAYIYSTGLAPTEQVNLSTGTITYLVADLLGSVRGAVSSTGALTATASYDAWGNPETVGGLTGTTPFGYAGGYTDPNGLVYLINRYYDPATGQFLSVDPSLSQTLAPYGYVNENPVSATDPNGAGGGATFYWYGYWNVGTGRHSISLWGITVGGEGGLQFCSYFLYLSNRATNYLVNNMTGPGAAFVIIGALVAPFWGAIGARIAGVGAAIYSLGWLIDQINRHGGNNGVVIELDFVRWYVWLHIWWLYTGTIYGRWHFIGIWIWHQ
jgi:RHS repeat-associated protein